MISKNLSEKQRKLTDVGVLVILKSATVFTISESSMSIVTIDGSVGRPR